jgi:hypothetical protein
VIFLRRNLVVSLSFVTPVLTKSNIIIRNILHEAVEEEEYEGRNRPAPPSGEMAMWGSGGSERAIFN